MGQHAVIGRASARAASLQHRRMKPSSVLVRAFQIKIGKTIVRTIFAVAQHKGMGGSAIEPHIENIEHLLIGLWVHKAGQKPFFGALLIPCICTFDLKRFSNAGVDLGTSQQKVFVCGQCANLGKAGQRHTPSALP